MRWWRLGTHPAIARAGGLWTVLRQARLAYRLFRDERVPTVAKLVVPAAMLYVISPLDFIPAIIPVLGRVDDLGVLVLALVAFVKLCPPHLVDEHEASLEGRPAASHTADEPI